MQFVIIRLSDKQACPLDGATQIGKTLFDDPVYAINAGSIDELFALATRARSSAPGDVGLVLWKRAPQGLSLPPELEHYPVVEIYDDVRD